VTTQTTRRALHLAVGGIVQGVGFRPFVYRLARELVLAGWVLNTERGVEIHVEGGGDALDAFVRALRNDAPAAARVQTVEVRPAPLEGCSNFAILQSTSASRPTARISPDLPVCAACLRELLDPTDRRFRYPYINCTDCGPRYSIVRGLPYDRPLTTMQGWAMCEACRSEYEDPGDRRFHAQPVACPACGPQFLLVCGDENIRGDPALAKTAALLRDGAIVALKGIGGYHLACDARNMRAIAALRERKYRKERPFAVMARDVAAARRLVELDAAATQLLESTMRPIVLAAACETLEGVAPDNRELGVMLPYTPLQHLLFADGAPSVLVMTSANRSSEPIAYEDADARERLAGIADAFLVGERPIARRIDDSIARSGAFGVSVLRRARGCAPLALAILPASRPILALGADLKNAPTLVVDGQAFVAQHIGDLEQYAAFESFRSAVADLCAMYDVRAEDLVVAHDAHPDYASSAYAQTLGAERIAVQHHRAHIASVLAERGSFSDEVVGVAFVGDDGTIWGGEIFTGSLERGFVRRMHLRTAALPGGDGAARFPVQAAAGYLAGIDGLPAFSEPPFDFPNRFAQARELLRARMRVFTTSSVGRLFDTVAALCGFTREATFEGQAAMWLQHQAETASGEVTAYPFPLDGAELDFRPALAAAAHDRAAKRDPREIALGFHLALADAIASACAVFASVPVVLSGGVFQNRLLLQLVRERLGERIWTNALVPANDGGISLGQAAIVSLSSTFSRTA